jgi:hypothetical protein
MRSGRSSNGSSPDVDDSAFSLDGLATPASGNTRTADTDVRDATAADVAAFPRRGTAASDDRDRTIETSSSTASKRSRLLLRRLISPIARLSQRLAELHRSKSERSHHPGHGTNCWELALQVLPASHDQSYGGIDCCGASVDADERHEMNYLHTFNTRMPSLLLSEASPLAL